MKSEYFNYTQEIIMFHKDLAYACHQLLSKAVQETDMPMGIVSHIYSGLYSIVAVNHPMGEFITGAVFPLNKTYCRDVVTTKKTIALTDIDGITGLRLHPLYVSLPLKAYISAPILHRGGVWGTVNFTSTHPRKPFTAADIERVEGYARRVSGWLDSMNAPQMKSS
jgi:GAF domain-containing protein